MEMQRERENLQCLRLIEVCNWRILKLGLHKCFRLIRIKIITPTCCTCIFWFKHVHVPHSTVDSIFTQKKREQMKKMWSRNYWHYGSHTQSNRQEIPNSFLPLMEVISVHVFDHPLTHVAYALFLRWVFKSNNETKAINFIFWLIV